MDDQEQCAEPFGDHERRYFIVDLTNPQNATFGTRLNYNLRLGQYVIRPILTERIGMGALDIAQLPCVGSTGPDGILEGAGTAVFTPQLNYVSDQDARFRVYTAATSVTTHTEFRELATGNVDYTALDTILTIPAGSMSIEVVVNIIDDDLVENTEGFQLVATAVENVRDGCQTWLEEADAWIIDDDAPPQLSVGDLDVAENAGIAAFAVSIDRVSASDITVGYATADGSATDTDDYTETSGTAQIDAGLTTAFVEVPLIDEMLKVVLHDPVGATLGDASAWATILDDDMPIVTVDDARASEDAGSLSFTVHLHEPGVYPASLRYTTLARPSEGDAAARPGADYLETTGKLDIAAGETTATISVPIIGDDIDEELEETFLLELSDAEALEFSDSAAVGTITDDDPGWVIDDASVWEDAGTEDAGSMVFTVIRDHTSTNAVTLNYTVTSASAMGGNSCTAGVDYITPSGSVTLLPAEKVVEITLTLCADDVAEGSESLLIELTGVPGRKLTGTSTIVDND